MKQYRLPTAEEARDRYVSRPPRDDDDEPCKRVLSVERRGRLTALKFGEAEAALLDNPEAWEHVWRHRHPASAEVYDGVRQLEARVIAE